MIAQDTGSAIIGPARADLYWGAGDEAGHVAGRIRHPGRFVMLVPRTLDLIAAGREMPLPTAKPKVLEADAKNENGNAKQGAAKNEGEARSAKKPRRQAVRVRWRFW